MRNARLHEVQMDGASENDTGVPLPGVEKCSCPQGYTGYSCETCAVGYTRSSTSILARCMKCNCNGHSSKCDRETGVCQDCLNNTTGKYCEICKPGFYRNSKAGSKLACLRCPCPHTSSSNSPTCSVDKLGEVVCDECPEGHEGKLCERCKESYTGNPTIPGEFCKPVSSCGCQHEGTKLCDMETMKCICKKNVEGEKCNTCKTGYYNLRKDDENGCTKCFCMGTGTSCRTSKRYTKPRKFSPRSSKLPAGLSITTEDFSRKTSDFVVDMRNRYVRFLDKAWLGQPNLYWTVPESFLGNQVLYYGGRLFISYYYRSLDKAATDNVRRPIKIKGNGLTIQYRNYPRFSANRVNNMEISLSESFWEKPDGDAVSRSDFMQVLVHIDAIMIPVTFSQKTIEARLGDITLFAASKKASTAKAEVCDCPANTVGSSCESCAEGYTRNGKLFGKCVPCQCNLHSTKCEPRTGICQDCEDNTAGDNCEICARGYFGEAKQGSRHDCKQCPCPLPGSTNRFSETCFLDRDGLPTCDACLEGYTGRRCEKCSLNYTGNPSIPGGKCFKVPVELIPKIKTVPQSLTVQEGDKARFVCNVESLRPAQILWSRKNGEPLSQRAKVSGNVLSFNSVKKADGGVYLCTANNDIALRTAKSVLVVKEQQLSAVIVDVSPKSRYIPVGGTAKFSCTSKTSSRYSITWRREYDKPLPPSAHVEDGTLIVSDAKLSDGGTYICTGRNALNIDRAIVSLHVGVVVKPQVSVSPRRQIVDIAQVVKFRCSASAGFPAATLRWERGDDRQLPRFSRFYSRSGVFKILAASRRDEGEYMCTASNRGGKSVMKVQLLVKGPNSLPKARINPRSLTVDEGERAVFRCEVSGDREIKVQWGKLGGILPRTALVRGSSLEITKTTIGDRGRYVCAVRNRYGQASAKASLFVNKDISMLPVVTIRPSGTVVSVMEGKTVTLECGVDGGRKIQIKWTRQLRRQVLSRQSRLILRNVKVGDTGIYECTGTTEKGEGKASVSVVVERNDILPKVQVWPSYVKARIGESISFLCKADSKIPVSIRWSREDGYPINPNHAIKGQRLVIESVRKKDIGTYICFVRNAFGASKATAELNVLTS